MTLNSTTSMNSSSHEEVKLASIHVEQDTLLVKKAIEDGNLEELKSLIQTSQSPDDMIREHGALEYPLHFAIEMGHFDIVSYLVKDVSIHVDVNGTDKDLQV